MRIRLLLLSLLMLAGYLRAGTDWRINKSTTEQLVIDFTFDVTNIDDLKPIELLIGLPDNQYPGLNASFQEKQNFPSDNLDLNISGVKLLSKQKLRGLYVAVLQITPYTGVNEYYKRARITITFTAGNRGYQRLSKSDQSLLVHRVINWDIAQNWGSPRILKRAKITDYPTGTWFRFTVPEDGIVAIPHQSFNNSATVIANGDPRSFMLFTSSTNGRDLSKSITSINQPIPDNLKETAIMVTGAADSSFDVGDQIIFYGWGASGFDITNNAVSHHQSIFYEENTYWLLIPTDSNLRGRRVESVNPITNPVNTLDYGIVYNHEEEDILNPYDTGNLWTGSQISGGSAYHMNFDLVEPTQDILPQIKVQMLGGNSSSHKIIVYHQSRFNPPLDSLTWSSAGLKNKFFTSSDISWQPGNNAFWLENASLSSNSKPYFNNLSLRSSRRLTYDGNNYDFFIDPTGNPVSLNFTASSEPFIWDITDPARPQLLTIIPGSGGFTVNIESVTDSIGHFVVFDLTDIATIEQVEEVPDIAFNTLRHTGPGINHIVVGPWEFSASIEPLVVHRGSSVFAPLEQVYNEFTGGNPDPLAIRLMIQWALENWSGTTPTCLFLIGDADHDYRNITGQSKIVVPTLFLEGSLDHYYSADDAVVTLYGPLPEIAVGRYPAHSVTDVDAYIEKLIAYETDPEPGLWRQRVTLVADDAARPEPSHGSISVGKSHTNNSESLIPYISPAVTVQKLYMMEYPEVSDASSYGVVKPAATQALFDLLNRGTAIISYIGHGSPHLWAQERLLDQNRGDINSIETRGRFPIWIAATCSWGHFDDIHAEAFSEDLIREPDDAAVAIITTSRPIGVDSNYGYIKKIFQRLFPNRQVTSEPIGVVLQSVKTGGISGKYFHLFGDPAMPLPIPTDTISITSLNPDPMRTLETAEFTGRQKLSSQGGTGYLMIQDAERTVTREYQISNQTEQLIYSLPGGTLFRGQFAIEDSTFNGQLRIPKDISYSSDPGKLSIYFQSFDDPPIEALGYREGLHFEGGSDVADNTGPIITFETSDGRSLRTGDHLVVDQGLIIRLADPVGINLAGEVGHGIIVSDETAGTNRDLTNDFIYDLNSITKGIIDYSIYMSGKTVDLKVSAWDNANNPAESTIRLSLQEALVLRLYHVLNYPNPFATSTQFTFEVTVPAEITIDVYTLQGRRIKTLPNKYFNEGYHFIDWDGRDEYGGRLANGVYLYRLQASDGDSKVSHIGKLAKYQ